MMRNNPSLLSTHLNTMVIGLGILLGASEKHDQAAGAPAMKLPDRANLCGDRVDEVTTGAGPRISATLT
jgi:hypothetical protein